MNVLIYAAGYRPIHRLTHWCISQLTMAPPPHQFREMALQPIAGQDVARSLAASQFLQDGKYDAILFLDDDILFNPPDALKLVKHLEEGKKVVGAAYVTKTKKPQCTTRFFDGQEVIFEKDAPPAEVMRLAGGFFMVAKEVVKKISNHLPFCNSKEPMGFWPMFMPYIKKSRIIFSKDCEYVTEDYAFMDRARDCGYKIWLDPSIRLGHMGQKEYVLEDIFSNGFEPKERIKLVREVTA